MAHSYLTGQSVPLLFTVTDSDGAPVSAPSASLTISLPDGSTSTVTLTEDVTGVYTADFVAAQGGRHVARFVAAGSNGGVVEVVFDVAAPSLAFVSVADVRAYLGDISASDATLTAALVAEQAAQASRCRIDPYGADLREALLRRVARNLAARSVPVTQFTSFEGLGTSTRVPTNDPEIARLEGPHRKMVVG